MKPTANQAPISENLRALRQWNTLCIVLAVLSLAILAGACVILYHFPHN